MARELWPSGPLRKLGRALFGAHLVDRDGPFANLGAQFETWPPIFGIFWEAQMGPGAHLRTRGGPFREGCCLSLWCCLCLWKVPCSVKCVFLKCFSTGSLSGTMPNLRVTVLCHSKKNAFGGHARLWPADPRSTDFFNVQRLPINVL